MKVVVAGDYKNPVLLSTNEATALLVETDDGQPAMIIKFLPNGKGYLRLFKGEDNNFDETARQLGLK